MKSTLAVCALLLSTFGIAHADDPLPVEEAPPAASDPTPAAPIAAEPATPDPAPAPASDAPIEKKPPVVKARISVPQPRTIRPRIKDDGESHLDKIEDTVAGGRHFRIKTAQGAVHV